MKIKSFKILTKTLPSSEKPVYLAFDAVFSISWFSRLLSGCANCKSWWECSKLRNLTSFCNIIFHTSAHPRVHQHFLTGNNIFLISYFLWLDLSINPERIVRWRSVKSVEDLISKENLLREKQKTLSRTFWLKGLKTIRP